MAPAVLVFGTDAERSAEQYGERGSHLYSIQDATIACTCAALASAALGLGSVFVGSFDEERVRRERRPMAELVHEL